MNSGIHSIGSEFSQFLGASARLEPVVLKNRIPTISGGGIVIYSPAVPMTNYPSLINRELLLKQGFISPRQQVHYLRLTGSPLCQFNGDELTELLFRLCSKYSVLEGASGERSITLSPEQCTSDSLALLKGLGFNNIRIAIDASTASDDRSLETVGKAIANIDTYRTYRISVTIFFSRHTNRLFIDKLVSFLAKSEALEIEFSWETGNANPFREHKVFRQMFRFIVELMQNLDYQLIGDRCFKNRHHPDLILLQNNKLAYGPWGFHNNTSPEWLALGHGAEGMIRGYLYHNTPDSGHYRDLINTGASPVDSWSSSPLAEQQGFEFIQQLYCHHQVEKRFFNRSSPLIALLENLKTMDWLKEQGRLCHLTEEGIINLPVICKLYNRAQ